MPARDDIDVKWPSIRSRWRSEAPGSVWLLLRTKNNDFPAFAAAILATNDDATNRGTDRLIFGEGPTATPNGYAVYLDLAADEDALRQWVDDLVDHLSEAGFSGSLTIPSTPRPPRVMEYSRPPVPTAFMFWTIDRESLLTQPQGGLWHVAADRGLRICSMVDAWTRHEGGIIHLGQAGFIIEMEAGPAPLVKPLLGTMYTSSQATVEHVSPDGSRVHHASLSFKADGLFQLVDDAAPWQDRVAGLREALLALSADLDCAFIRPTYRAAQSRSDVDVVQPLPHLTEMEVRYNPHLMDRFVPDAHGIQVLTSTHLENASNLDQWSVIELSQDRFLVEAPDLTPWYSTPLPDPAVVGAARHDFGDMLLTPEAISAHPLHMP